MSEGVADVEGRPGSKFAKDRGSRSTRSDVLRDEAAETKPQRGKGQEKGGEKQKGPKTLTFR